MTLTALSHPTATQVRVGLMTVLDEGWLAFESIKLSSLSAPIAVRPGQDHTLAAQINGQVNGANAARLFIKYSNGTIHNMWQNTGVFNGSQSVNGSFTTPTGVNSFQVGTAVTLDKGYLEFSKVTLTAYSAALPITAGGTYQFTGQVAGALAAPLGQGGRIVAAYTNVDGQSAGEDLLWQNPTNFNGTVPVQQTVTANANAATLRLALTAVLDAGHLDFGDFALQRLAAGAVIRRSTYMLAGTAVAVRVTGDPDGNDGLHYLYSDHLGSASAIQNSDGSAPIITRYLPFGGYRAGSGTNEVMDRGFTGHKHNDDLGLVYMNARFYVSGIGRFASADTIVPDPQNPQQYNRYTYTLNNPLRYSDPTGHLSVDEMREYFGFDNPDQMLDLLWSEELVRWLWDNDVTWGDVFLYNGSETDAAMLVMYEFIGIDGNATGTYVGGFVRLTGDYQGQSILPHSIFSLNDHHSLVNSLESLYDGNYDELPSDNYYHSAMYSDVQPAALSIGGLTVAAVGTGATTVVVVATCGSNPIGWIGCGTSALGGGWGLFATGATFVGAGVAIFSPIDSVEYPLMQAQSWFNPSRTWGWGMPEGYYRNR